MLRMKHEVMRCQKKENCAKILKLSAGKSMCDEPDAEVNDVPSSCNER